MEQPLAIIGQSILIILNGKVAIQSAKVVHLVYQGHIVNFARFYMSQETTQREDKQLLIGGLEMEYVKLVITWSRCSKLGEMKHFW